MPCRIRSPGRGDHADARTDGRSSTPGTSWARSTTRRHAEPVHVADGPFANSMECRQNSRSGSGLRPATQIIFAGSRPFYPGLTFLSQQADAIDSPSRRSARRPGCPVVRPGGAQPGDLTVADAAADSLICRIEGVAKFVYLCVGLYVNNGRSDPAFSIVIRIGGARITPTLRGEQLCQLRA